MESIQSRLLNGQLDDTPLTVEDLRTVQRTFVDVLRGLQHPRVEYPAEAQPGQAAAALPDQLPPPARPDISAEESKEPALVNQGSGSTSVF